MRRYSGERSSPIVGLHERQEDGIGGRLVPLVILFHGCLWLLLFRGVGFVAVVVGEQQGVFSRKLTEGLPLYRAVVMLESLCWWIFHSKGRRCRYVGQGKEGKRRDPEQ